MSAILRRNTESLEQGRDYNQLVSLEALMAAVQGRDEEAFARLYDLTVAQVYGLAMHLLRHAADAEEVVCQVYEQAWWRASRYDVKRGPVVAWLLVMCRSRALDALQERRARVRRDERAGADDEALAEGPEALLGRWQEGGAVHRAVAGLTPLRRQLVALAFFRDLSHQELADRFALPLGTIKSHLRRSLAELRRALAIEGVAHEHE
jgi:RNA polymerase sigma-70 factor (ECF subfamily)